MSAFPEVAQVIESKLSQVQTELAQLEAARKAKKAELRLLRSALSKMNGQVRERKSRQRKDTVQDQTSVAAVKKGPQ